jgi:hypothetical protein
MPALRVHNLATCGASGATDAGERLFDGPLDGYECVELVSSPSVAHVRLARRA